MKLVIDTRNGIAGDIVNAGLIGLGANGKQMISSMEYAGSHIGTTEIKSTKDHGAIRLKAKIEMDYDHLHERKAKRLLGKIISDLSIARYYRDLTIKVLDVLCDAERHVHSHDERLHHMLHPHREYGVEAVLHEAKDILIDATGLSTGLQELNVNEIGFVDYVSVGNGTIRFSHGEFEVPAPATEYILNKYSLNWKKSNIYNEEMATPTGVSILAGCRAKRIDTLKDCHIIKKSLAMGTKKGLPPISFYLIE